MTHTGNIYNAESGKLIVRKDDDYVMGESIDLGSADDISNYEEREFTERTIEEFKKQWGIVSHEERTHGKRGKRKE